MDFTPMNAASLIEEAYTRKRHHNEADSDYETRKMKAFTLPDNTEVKVIETYDINEAEAFALEGGILVIPGSDSIEDYTRYNLNYGVLALVDKLKRLFKPKGIVYHKGFLAHSKEIEAFAKLYKIKKVTGHSLGAASSQLLASRLKLEAINFAAPKVVRKGWPVRVKKNSIKNFNRKDDSVTRFPGWRWKHVGDVVVLDTEEAHIGPDHKIKHYITAMGMDHVQEKSDTMFT